MGSGGSNPSSLAPMTPPQTASALVSTRKRMVLLKAVSAQYSPRTSSKFALFRRFGWRWRRRSLSDGMATEGGRRSAPCASPGAAEAWARDGHHARGAPSMAGVVGRHPRSPRTRHGRHPPARVRPVLLAAATACARPRSSGRCSHCTPVLFLSSRGVAAALSLRVEREYNIPSSSPRQRPPRPWCTETRRWPPQHGAH